MSNIYILEPPTLGKILLKTTVGDIDVELWSKETPKCCRNFIQLCLEGYYDGTIFHRVVKNFIVQGGDPNGDGTGGESIYEAPFKDEFHQRLRFTRRGLLAMANAGKDDNGSQFFFTLGPTPELQNKHTLFGKVTGDTIFNMLKLEEGLIEGERPVYPHKIISTEVLNNPFPNIVPRKKLPEFEEKKSKEKKSGVKNFKLLSFGEEAEEDEEESTRENEKFLGRGKSTHDVLDDPKLSSNTEPVSNVEQECGSGTDAIDQLENIRKKLKMSSSEKKSKQPKLHKPEISEHIEDEDIEEYYLNKDRDMERMEKMKEIRKEIEDLKKSYQKNRLKKDEGNIIEHVDEYETKSVMFREYKKQYDTYKNKKDLLPKKGLGREQFTLSLLEKFKEKLHSAKEKEDVDEEDNDDLDNEEKWLSHKLKFEDNDPILAKDANTKADDWFEIYDPRHSLNKRRRGEHSKTVKK